MMEQMELFDEGGLRDEGGAVEPESGNEVPSGALKKEVADDIPVMISEGEFVFPADVVRYIGLETLMKMRQNAKQGLKTMEKMGQMGNSEEATIPDDVPFGMADLIVVSGEMKKKDKEEKAEGGVIGLQTGGSLFDDPRFKRPDGGDTPTITPEEKEEIEDALLRTGYGNVVMKRYVNADGDVLYVPFIDGEPQMEIPEGYELDESAPKQQTSIGGGGDSRDRGDSGGPASPTPAFGDGVTFQKPRGPMVDGVEYETLDKMDDETLIKYYEQFNSPIYRYAATFATLLFSPLVGGAIAIGQSYSNKNSPTGLNAVQQELMTRNLSKEQRARAKIVFDDIKKKGAGGLSAITKGVTNFLGLTSDKEKGEKETDFEKYLRTGNVKGANNELNNAINKSQENKKVFENANREGLQKYITEGGMGMDIDRRETPQQTGVLASGLNLSDPADRTPPRDELSNPFEDFELPEDAEVLSDLREDEIFDYGFGTLGSPAQAATVERETVERDPMDMSDRPFVTREDQIGYEATFDALRNAGSSDENARELASDVVENLQKERKDRTKKRLQTSFGTDYGKSRAEQAIEQLIPEPVVVDQTPPSDIDYSGYESTDTSDDGGSPDPSNVIGSGYYQPNPRSDYTTDYNPPAPTGQSPGFPGESAPSFGGGYSAPPTYDYGSTGPFYVGGVATKPMKPQRLKKGGLAKMKVKPRRMKKGGLASRKK